MDALTLRVSARYHRQVVAAFISAKWFKEKKAQFRDILKEPLRDSPDYWGWSLRKVGLFFDQFLQEFSDQISFDQAVTSIKGRVEMAKDYLGAITEKVEKFASAARDVDFKDPAAYLRWYAVSEIQDKVRETVQTLGDLYRYSWSISDDVLDKLVKKTLKQATPEEIAFLTQDTYDKYRFLSRIGYKKSAMRAVKRSKLDWDPNKWVDRIYEMLQANYSEQAIQEQGAFRQFDVQGMKVIVDDTTVDASDIKKYVALLIEARARLKARGFGDAWYGNVFIQCADCGGVNPNTGGGVGGEYRSWVDTVTIFQRPDLFVVELMVHELGHRYWFKSLNSAQRARFEELVKVHTVSRPSKVPDFRLFGDQDIKAHKRKVEELQRLGERLLVKARTIEFTPKASGDKEAISKAFWDLSHDVVEAIDALQVDPDIKVKVEPYKESARKARGSLISISDDLVFVRDAEAGAKWIEDVEQRLQTLIAEALVYLDYAIAQQNASAREKIESDPDTKAWMESYDKNPGTIPGVSTYGKSNVREAFAEVFTHYVLEYDMTRDQMESFRSVLSSCGPVETVLRRFLASGPDA